MKIFSKKYLYLCSIVASCMVLVHACKKDTLDPLGNDYVEPEDGEEYPGGKLNTVSDVSGNAFSYPSPGLTGDVDNTNFFVGNSFFKVNWVPSPASTTARDGLGPTFNTLSCSGCHLKDGRGMPPTHEGEMSVGLLIRLSIPGTDPHGGPNPDPNYGGQLNDRGIMGVDGEGTISIAYNTINGAFDDGTPYTLQEPVYSVKNMGYGPFGGGIMMSPRVGQQVIGLGLLEAIEESRIVSLADENDANGDGISGKANYVWDAVNNKNALGRFGWKANQPSLRQQSAGAFVGDMGITTSLFPEQNCTGIQTGCLTAPSGGTPELEDDDLERMIVYISNLAVPARRDPGGKNILLGKKLFNRMGCASCHVAKHTTGTHPRFTNLSAQTIFPYTDLLLHDMGSGLADGRPDYLANGNEWRTAPLWGIGLIHAVNGHTRLLHDGRARNVEEAVLWHGGEAEKSKNAYKALSKDDRTAVLDFLNSL